MSQPMPPTPHAYAPQPVYAPQRTSAAAVTSLICGILGCFIITGFIAIITGIIGLKATKNPNVKGRGLAIAGLILGVLTTLGGAGCLVTTGGAIYWAYKESQPVIAAANGFTKAISNADANAAMQYVDTNAISKSEVEKMINQLKPLGTPSDMKMSRFDVDTVSGVIDIRGTLDYPGGVSKTIGAQARKQSDGTVKITSLEVK